MRPQLRAVVAGRERLGSQRIRLTFSGDDVAAFIRLEAAQAPCAWIKLSVPSSSGDSVRRAYTLRMFDLDKGTFSVDFVLHEGGVMSAWAQAAQVGDAVGFAGPRRGGFALCPDSEWIVLIGDETALPAIQTILTSLPPHLPGIVLIETDCPGEHEAFFAGPNIRLSWTRRTSHQPGADCALVEALNSVEILPGTGQAWVAGEADSVKAVRGLLQEKWKLLNTSGKGYWKRDVADFRP